MIRWRRSGAYKQAKWSATYDERQRHAHARRAANSGRHPRRADDVRCERPRHEIPADRTAASAPGRTERSCRPDRRRGIRRLECVWRTVPDADVREARRRWPQVQSVSHDGALLSDAGRAASRAQPSHGGDGRHHRAGDVGAGTELDSSEHLRAARRGAQAERLLDGAVRQMPRGPGVGDEPRRSVRALAEWRRRLRVLLRIHRRRNESVLSRHLRRHDAGRAKEDARGGLPLHHRHDREGGEVDPATEVAHARQAVLHLLRARCDARAASRSEGMGRQVQGQVRSRVGQAPRGDFRPAEDARRHSRGLRPHEAPRRASRVGHDRAGDEAGARAADGDLRRLSRAHRPSRRAARRRAAGPGHPERHADLRDHRRQRRIGGGIAAGHVQRDDHAQWFRSARDRGIHVVTDRQVRRPRSVQPLRRGLGARHGHAVSMDQAGRVTLGRHAQRHDRALAARNRCQRRSPDAVPPRDRRVADRTRGRASPAADDRRRRAATADRRRQHGVLIQRRQSR